MSEQNPNASDSRVETALVPAGAPVHGIEVTPTMIGAGAYELLSAVEHLFPLSHGHAELLAERVIAAALSALPPRKSPASQ